jgi:hypothetical protein
MRTKTPFNSLATQAHKLSTLHSPTAQRNYTTLVDSVSNFNFQRKAIDLDSWLGFILEQ